MIHTYESIMAEITDAVAMDDAAFADAWGSPDLSVRIIARRFGMSKSGAYRRARRLGVRKFRV